MVRSGHPRYGLPCKDTLPQVAHEKGRKSARMKSAYEHGRALKKSFGDVSIIYALALKGGKPFAVS